MGWAWLKSEILGLKVVGDWEKLVRPKNRIVKSEAVRKNYKRARDIRKLYLDHKNNHRDIGKVLKDFEN